MKRLWLIVLISTQEIIFASTDSGEFVAHEKINSDDTDRMNVGASEATATALDKTLKAKSKKAYLQTPESDLTAKGSQYFAIEANTLIEPTFAVVEEAAKIEV